MRGKNFNHLTRCELEETAALLRARGPLLVVDVQTALETSEKRARQLLQVVSLPPAMEKTRCGFKYRYTIHPDAAHLIEKHAHAAARRTPRWLVDRLKEAQRPTFPTGDPTHFDVDWLGRVVYRGPVTAKDARFQMEGDTEPRALL